VNVQVATPADIALAEQPVMEVPPDLKLMVPVGVATGPVTVAVRVVEVPTVVGDGEAVKAVAVIAVLTVSALIDEVAEV
jgi:hypothetical protein